MIQAKTRRKANRQGQTGTQAAAARTQRDPARVLLAWGALLAGAGVALGAFGAHGLRGRLDPEMLMIFETGVRYQLWHALALLVVGVLRLNPNLAPSPTASSESSRRLRARVLARVGWLFVLGIVLFSGSLYALSLTGVRTFGAITPFGGVAFLAGWTLLAWEALRGRSR